MYYKAKRGKSTVFKMPQSQLSTSEEDLRNYCEQNGMRLVGPLRDNFPWRYSNKAVRSLWQDRDDFVAWGVQQEKQFPGQWDLGFLCIGNPDKVDGWRLVPQDLIDFLESKAVLRKEGGRWKTRKNYLDQPKESKPTREEALRLYWTEKIMVFKRAYTGQLDSRLFYHCLETLQRQMNEDLRLHQRATPAVSN